MAVIENVSLARVSRINVVKEYLHSLANRIHQYREYSKTVAELEALSDHTLSDLGIFRCDIRSTAKQIYYRNK